MYSYVDGDFSYISRPVSPHCLDSYEDGSNYDRLGEFSFTLLLITSILNTHNLLSCLPFLT